MKTYRISVELGYMARSYVSGGDDSYFFSVQVSNANLYCEDTIDDKVKYYSERYPEYRFDKHENE